MINPSETVLDPAFQFKKKMDILFSVNNYSCETLKPVMVEENSDYGLMYTTDKLEGPTEANNTIVTRNIDFITKKPKNMFNYLVNDCKKEPEIEEPINYKYNRIIIDKNYGNDDDGESQDEDIDSMIKDIKNDIKRINKNITYKKKDTMILNTTMFKNYEKNEEWLNKKYYELNNKKILQQSNDVLKALKDIDDYIFADNIFKRI